MRETNVVVVVQCVSRVQSVVVVLLVLVVVVLMVVVLAPARVLWTFLPDEKCPTLIRRRWLK